MEERVPWLVSTGTPGWGEAPSSPQGDLAARINDTSHQTTQRISIPERKPTFNTENLFARRIVILALMTRQSGNLYKQYGMTCTKQVSNTHL